MRTADDRQPIVHRRNRLKQLRGFCRVTRLGNFTRAAESLGLAQPTVSLLVSALEKEFGAFLFDRKDVAVSLTLAGERLYALVEPLVRRMVANDRGCLFNHGCPLMTVRIRPVVALALGLLVAACGGGIFIPYAARSPDAPSMLNAELTPNNNVVLT